MERDECKFSYIQCMHLIAKKYLIYAFNLIHIHLILNLENN